MKATRRFGSLGTWLLTSVCLVGCGGNGDSAAVGNAPEAAPTAEGWQLVWADEFDGDALDADKWNVQTGDGSAEGIPGWGNNELQVYGPDNIAVRNGNLVISARLDAAGGGGYTSGRINTDGKFASRYGRIEASIRVPAGQGLWSAFWLLPTNSPYGGWAASGEIDIMEVFTRQPEPFTQGAAHYGMVWPLNVFVAQHYSGIDPADGFHTYALEWEESELRWFVDGVHFYTVPNSAYWTYYRDPATNAHRSGGDSAPFDQPFHLLLNLAVGGNLPGAPVPEALPGEMLVDYVRVYRCAADPTTGRGCAGIVDAVDPNVVPAAADDVFRVEYTLFDDMLGPLVLGEDETLALNFGIYDDGALVLSQVRDGERGMVVDVTTSGGGSFSIHAADGSRLRFFGMGSVTNTVPLGGELQFDLRVFGTETDADGSLRIRLHSGLDAAGFVELALRELPADEWTTVTVQVTDIIRAAGSAGGALDMERIVGLFALEPTGSAHIRLDNIVIVCGHSQENGCGIVASPAPESAAAKPQRAVPEGVTSMQRGNAEAPAPPPSR